MKRRTADRRTERGQSTVEFLLMLPLLLASFFFIIEMSLYFTTVHYQSYATYAAARAHAVGEDPKEVADMLLTGKVFKYKGGNYTVEMVTNNSPNNNAKTAQGVRIQLEEWRPQFPFMGSSGGGNAPGEGGGILPANGLRFNTSTYLGPPECTYEQLNQPQYYDNNVSQCCYTMNGSRQCI